MAEKKAASVRIEPLEMRHAPFIQRYASDAAVAATTTLPHPYPENGRRRVCPIRSEPSGKRRFFHLRRDRRGLFRRRLRNRSRQARTRREAGDRLLDWQAVLGARIRIRGGARRVDARLFGTRLPDHRVAQPHSQPGVDSHPRKMRLPAGWRRRGRAGNCCLFHFKKRRL